MCYRLGRISNIIDVLNWLAWIDKVSPRPLSLYVLLLLYYVRTFSFSFSLSRPIVEVTQIQGHLSKQALLPPPYYGTRLHCYREKVSALAFLCSR